jgi:NADH-quinone oxidoreductase subunit L
MSPLFELSDAALGFVTVIGATTALFMGFLGIVQNDIKRVVAYSTLSQLGYMTVALGVSAYPAAIFHLMTHAFFKALLFLAAGSVIIALHHEQDLRKMGGLRKYMPVTYWTALIGALALCGIPPFAGFFSKDAIIEAADLSQVPGHGYAAFAVTIGVFITAFYTFRMLFLAFHGEERFRHAEAHGHGASEEPGHDPEHGHGDPHESPWVVTLPLVLLAIPSVYSGWAYVDRVLFGNYFGDSIVIARQHAGLATMTEEWHGPWAFVVHGLTTLPFWLAIAGVASAWFLYVARADLPDRIAGRAGALYRLLANNYYIDRFNDWFFAGGFRRIGTLFSNVGDRSVIDGFFVNGSARLVAATSAIARQLQSGFIYQYAFAMVLGVVVFLFWWLTLRAA